KKEYMYQSNMRNAFPVMVSSEGYAIFIDTESSMIFTSEKDEIIFQVEAGKTFTYYIILADDMDGIVSKLREMTGRASMLPRFAFGYIQSKERYNDGEELVDIKNTFREKNIPIDCLVQDWYTWEEGKWGQKTCDKSRYPDLKVTLDNLHDDHVKLMWSIWPNMSETAENYHEFKEKKLLMGSSPVYNSFSEEGRKLYGEQCMRELFAAGLDAWWCDNAEPYSDADWSGEDRREEALRYQLVVEEAAKHIPLENVNAYCLYHAKGIYDTWKNSESKKRVLNLTRSVYAGAQSYGTILWSGDICARWDVMKKQIAEGLKTSLCGFPYWTLDIGAFFTVKDKYENRGCNNARKVKLWFWDGEYNEGVHDLGYCELYTRWFQYGTFLPIFRSHGTDTPREPWQFGNKELPFEDILTKYIRLRYTLMPYIYSLAGHVHFSHGSMMRSLLFDFSHDEKAIGKSDVFMLGKEFLVCPVTKPMYYNPNSEKITIEDYTVSVYLPEGTKWYDYWTNTVYEGGKDYDYEAPIETMPLFVKAGAIVPTSEAMSYADERKGAIKEIDIYAGADGTFTVYNDAGDGDEFEKGEFSTFIITYIDETREVTISNISGNYPVQGQLKFRVIGDGSTNEMEVNYTGEEMTFVIM
ncbi:MAG: glycoside hydrolase family 31 protein, partial [Eubacteriales bacterium]